MEPRARHGEHGGGIGKPADQVDHPDDAADVAVTVVGAMYAAVRTGCDALDVLARAAEAA